MVPRGSGSTLRFGLLYAWYEGNEMSDDDHSFNREKNHASSYRGGRPGKTNQQRKWAGKKAQSSNYQTELEEGNPLFRPNYGSNVMGHSKPCERNGDEVQVDCGSDDA